MTTIDLHQRTPSVHLGERVRRDRPRPVAWPDIPCAPADVYEPDEEEAPAARGPDASDTGRDPARKPGRR